MDPYGGPHAQRVVQSYNAYLSSQWFADQGFAVVIVDGRGTPGRGSEHERAVHGDLASLVLEDQIDGLYQAADELGFLDLDRVGIRGWSFGGYLAALAVLRVPTSSTPPSPARPPPSGGCTTRSTPSATSATRPRTPRRTTTVRCSHLPTG